MPRVYTFKKAVAKLVQLKARGVGTVDKGSVCKKSVKCYATREDKQGDEKYTFKLGDNCSSPLLELSGTNFMLSPMDLDVAWVIVEEVV